MPVRVLRCLLLPVLAGVAACGGNPRHGQYVGDLVTATGFESVLGWGGDEAGLTRQQVHSGRMAAWVGPGRETSLPYRLPTRLASVHALKAVELDAWVWPTDAASEATLLVRVLRPDGTLLGDEALRLREQAPQAGRWQQVHHIFTIPPDLPWDSELQILMQRGSQPGPVYLDDLTIKARE